GEILPPLEKPVDFTSGSAYLADQGLRDAVNVALTLGDPLLLTGEAGCGKTQLAASIAYEFDLGPPLVFNAKSTSGARDLFYRYDSLRHFHDIQVRGTRELKSVDIRRLRPVASKTSTERRAERPKPVNVLDYIDFQALGLAVLLSKPPEEVAAYLKPRDRDRGPRRSVVLIDEIDKAPRDLPNDLLNEIEEMEFTVPEIGKRFQAEAGYRPIVIITSNTQKNLPEAFLRRC
ncbi:MAG: AAA family ATPase, partial [Planctomyces sp.]